ncbi:MAG: Hsp20/alpha crystallin family protein [Candidatus Altiarchaeota archaeon]
MFPFDKKKRPSLFGDFDSFFAEFEDQEGEMMNHAHENMVFYGYSSYTGPDGKTTVREYSNIPGFKGMPAAQEEQKLLEGSSCGSGGMEVAEPYYEVAEEKDQVKVVADMPGVDEKEIKLNLKGSLLTIKAGNEHRNYKAEITLPVEVRKKAEKTLYKNGVLEAVYRKA